MTRFEDLLETVEIYQSLAAENYTRIRTLAEDLRDGMCRYLDAGDGNCVRLVPPAGKFEPKDYGKQAFSVPPEGFRPLGPISFGLAVRVSHGTDWLRIPLECSKEGERFFVNIPGQAPHEFALPLADAKLDAFYEAIHHHIRDWFATRIERYREGDSGTREIGFDLAAAGENPQA